MIPLVLCMTTDSHAAIDRARSCGRQFGGPSFIMPYVWKGRLMYWRPISLYCPQEQGQ